MSDDPNPVVTAYPECAICGTAFVYRRCWSLSNGWHWFWQRDCKHRSAPRIAGEEPVGESSGSEGL